MPQGHANGRWWIFTLSCEHHPDQPALHPDAVYAKGQQEIGEGGFRHWQFVVCFRSNKRLRGAVAAYPQSHAEATRSAAAQDYVWKEQSRVEGTQFEHGEPPFKRNNKVDWERQLELAKRGNLDEMDPGVLLRNYTSVVRIAAASYIPVVRTMPIVKVFWGRTGAGKSHNALLEAQGDDPDLKDVYFKSGSNKWWDGYNGQTKVVIEEFDGLIHITHLLKWFDKYPCQVEIKGAAVPLLGIKFWVTSNKSPEEWWDGVQGCKPSAEQMAALRRRIQVTHFERQWVPSTTRLEEEIAL